MRISFRLDDLQGPAVQDLLRTHLETMASQSPPESTHALDLDSLRADDVIFWSVWAEATLLGIGALKELDGRHGEVKSMHIAEASRGRGIAARLLDHIMDEAGRRGYARLSLETGSMQAFAPARALYVKYGFIECAPFAGYREDPNSVFMTRTL